MDIKVLGPGCGNCVRLEKHTREALADLGASADIEKVTDYGQIMSYGVMATPGLVVDGRVVVSGSVPNAKAIAQLLAPLTPRA